MSHSLSGLVMIKHRGGYNSEFHFKVKSKEGEIIDKSYNYFGEETDFSDSTKEKSADIGDIIIDCPVRKAFHFMVLSDKNWNIYRITASKTEKIAEVSNDSKFGLKLFGQIRSSEMPSTLFGKKKSKSKTNK